VRTGRRAQQQIVELPGGRQPQTRRPDFRTRPVSSGADKTALQDATLLFCPPEDVVKLTSLTGKALFYKGRTSLKHKILAVEEGVGIQEATYAIRNLVTAKELVIEAAVKDFTTGRITTMENRVEDRRRFPHNHGPGR